MPKADSEYRPELPGRESAVSKQKATAVWLKDAANAKVLIGVYGKKKKDREKKSLKKKSVQQQQQQPQQQQQQQQHDARTEMEGGEDEFAQCYKRKGLSASEKM